MAGIFPDKGVPRVATVNGVSVPLANCPMELFYSEAECTPKLSASAANAAISELLNVTRAAGVDYDCARLDNLARSIKALGAGITVPALAVTGVVIEAGEIVKSSDGCLVWNNSQSPLFPGPDTSCAGLRAEGLAPVGQKVAEFAPATLGANLGPGAVVYSSDYKAYWNGGPSVVTLAGGTTGDALESAGLEALTISFADSVAVGAGQSAVTAISPAGLLNAPAYPNGPAPPDRIWMQNSSLGAMGWATVAELMGNAPLAGVPVNRDATYYGGATPNMDPADFSSNPGPVAAQAGGLVWVRTWRREKIRSNTYSLEIAEYLYPVSAGDIISFDTSGVPALNGGVLLNGALLQRGAAEVGIALPPATHQAFLALETAGPPAGYVRTVEVSAGTGYAGLWKFFTPI